MPRKPNRLRQNKEQVAVIHDWRIVGDLYRAPEVRSTRVCGLINNHKTTLTGVGEYIHVINNDRPATTGPIVDCEGRYFKTYSGSLYSLGRIQKEYRAWIRKNKLQFNWRSPITKKDENGNTV